MSKIIGFYIGKDKKEFNPDVFHSGINEFTFEGAAYATVLAQAMGTLVFPFFINKTRKSFFMMIRVLLLIDLLKFKRLAK
jgi:Na+-driven multidrug efflux pump